MHTPFGLPEIFKEEAKGDLKLVYEDIEYVLKVPIVNFIFRTLGHYEQFLQIGWRQIRPNMLTINIENAAEALRYPNTSFRAPTISWNRYYSKETLETIQKIIFTFNYVNTKLLIISTAWEESLGYRSIEGGKPINGLIQPGIISGLPPIKLVHIPQAPPLVQNLLIRIMKKKHAYDAASDYRALAVYPDFLDITWNHIESYIGSDEYVLAANKVKSKAIKMVHQQMPYPVSITPEFLYTMYTPREVAGIMGIISMFSSFIANLVVNGELFRKFL
ncbi:halocarboxylic acid dehydrogenase DehI family protein [Cytobacillus sp. FJAT-54145]|uniref:Halocarboxylic acid dehydrogenase DehI family protein n=1 Tax=Cytobacillus spartinae TaxID=3299023 RepID=A0ABW6K6N5_9BACI